MRQLIIGAFQHPFRDPRAVWKLLVGALFNTLPIVNLFAFGYTLRLLEQVLGGEGESMPEWTEFTDLFVRGIKVLLVASVYMMFPLLLFAAGANLGLCSIAAVVSGTVEPMAQVRLARTGRVQAGLALSEIWMEVRPVLPEYLEALVIWYGIFILIGVLLSGTGPPLLWLLGSFVGFYLYLFFAALFGRVCAENRTGRCPPF